MAYQDEYMPKYRGGSTWDEIYGKLPDSQYYDANGGVHKKGGFERFQDFVFSPAGFATGIGAASLAPALAGAFGGGSAAAGASGAASAGAGAIPTVAAGAAPAAAAGAGGGVLGSLGGWGGLALLGGQIASSALSSALAPDPYQKKQSFAGTGPYTDPTTTLRQSNMNIEDVLNALQDYQPSPITATAPAVPGVSIHDPYLDSQPEMPKIKTRLRKA